MSMMQPPMGGPPPSISIGGPGPGGPPPGADASDPNEDPAGKFKAALEKLGQDAVAATALAHDPIDKSAMLKIAAAIHSELSSQQKEMDSVMGGGPGVKLIRRATPPAGA